MRRHPMIGIDVRSALSMSAFVISLLFLFVLTIS